MSEVIRRDYILDRWVIFSPKRARRPSEFPIRRPRRRPKEVCPFCPGNERMTTPATLLYLPSDKGIIKSKDSNGDRPSNWLVRCFPNLYPALEPEWKRETEEAELVASMPPRGFHEVLVESPHHYEHPGVARLRQLKLAIESLIDRMNFFATHEYVKYVSIFRNHGRMGGATLSHAHMQIIALPLIPRLIAEELNAARDFLNEKGECAFCKVTEEERRGPRLIYEDDHFVSVAPWASVHPYEFWILPLKHQSTLLEVSEAEKRSLAKAIRSCLGSLYRKLNDPPYNFGFHLAPLREKWDFYHWHLEVYPCLSLFGGLEKSMGLYINTVLPESVAQLLRC